MSRRPPPPVARSGLTGRMSSDGATIKPETNATASGPKLGAGSKQIPAAVFARLVGRSLRTLRNWDEAGLTHPEVRSSRRYYGADDLVAVLSSGSGKGPREGSIIKYLGVNWDKGR